MAIARRWCIGSMVLFAAACSGKVSTREVTVRGVVISPTGRPLAGLRVSIAGEVAVTTGADGRFEFSAVMTPYTVVVGQPEWSRAVAFVGLTLSDPVLPFTPAGSWTRSGGVCGGASGPPGTPDAAWVFTETPSGSNSAIRNTIAAFCTAGTWNGATEVPATVHMIECLTRPVGDAGASWVATAFPAEGSAAVVLTDGATLHDTSLSLSPAAVSTLSVSAVLPAGWSAMLTVDGFYGPSHFDGLPLAFVDGAQPWPSVAIPALSGFRTHVWVWGYGAEGGTHVHRILDAPATTLDLTVPLSPALIAPNEGAVDVVPGTRFSWSTFEGGDLSMLFVRADEGWSLKVYTNDSSAVLPDLSRVGVAIPAGARAQWDVVGFGKTGGVDGLATLAHAARAELDARAMSEEGEVAFVAAPRALTFR